MKKIFHMESSGTDSPFGTVAHVDDRDGGDVVVVCEHASNRMPAGLGGLGLAPELLTSHIAWDPGALGLARALGEAGTRGRGGWRPPPRRSGPPPRGPRRRRRGV